MTKILVTLVNFNGNKDTLSCLDSLDRVKIQDFELSVVVVDNASREIFQTEKEFKNFKLKIIKSDKNLGFAGGQNLGIQYGLESGIDYFCVLNNDVILDDNFLNELLRTFKDEKNCGIVSPKIYFAKGHEFHKDRYKKSEFGKVFWYAGGIIDRNNVYTSHRGVDEIDRGQYDKVEETDVANGACVIIKREVFEKIGLLDSSFFLYWEDADFSERAKKAGFKVMYYSGTCMWHKVSASTGGSGSPTNDYFLTRNRFYYSMRYSSLRTKFAVLRDTIRLIFMGRTWQKWGAADAILGRKGMGQWAKR